MTDATLENNTSKVHLPIADRERKIVVVVDETPESKVAIRFSAGRASHISRGGLVLFHCVKPSDFQHWIAVADRMSEEAYEEAEILLSEIAERVYAYCGVSAEIVIVEGEPQEELKKYMDVTDGLFTLILGANADGDPGPLVDYFSGPTMGNMPVPVMIIPGNMSYETVDSLV